jgi:hypothetical protein
MEVEAAIDRRAIHRGELLGAGFLIMPALEQGWCQAAVTGA